MPWARMGMMVASTRSPILRTSSPRHLPAVSRLSSPEHKLPFNLAFGRTWTSVQLDDMLRPSCLRHLPAVSCLSSPTQQHLVQHQVTASAVGWDIEHWDVVHSCSPGPASLSQL